MISFLSRTIEFFFFFLSLWIYLWLAETSQQPISQTTWLKVTPHCNHCNYYWFRSAVKLFNSMLNTNSDTLQMVFQADLNFQPRSSACWTAQLLSAFQGLRGCELYVQAVQTGHAITMQELLQI